MVTQHCAHIPFLSYMCAVVQPDGCFHCFWSLRSQRLFFPFLEVSMRGPVKKSQSVKAFKGRVSVTSQINLQRNRRGGIRL